MLADYVKNHSVSVVVVVVIHSSLYVDLMTLQSLYLQIHKFFKFHFLLLLQEPLIQETQILFPKSKIQKMLYKSKLNFFQIHVNVPRILLQRYHWKNRSPTKSHSKSPKTPQLIPLQSYNPNTPWNNSGLIHKTPNGTQIHKTILTYDLKYQCAWILWTKITQTTFYAKPTSEKQFAFQKVKKTNSNAQSN